MCDGCDENNKAVAIQYALIVLIFTNNFELSRSTLLSLSLNLNRLLLSVLAVFFILKKLLSIIVILVVDWSVVNVCLLTKKMNGCPIDNTELLKKEKDELQSVPGVEEAISPIVKAAKNINDVVKRIRVTEQRSSKRRNRQNV